MSKSFLPHVASCTPTPFAWRGWALQRKCACGSPSATGECEACREEKALGLQKRLSIGASHDPLEREADQAAATVMRMDAAAPAMSNHGVAARLSRRGASGGGEAASMAPPSVDTTLSASGEALPASLRGFFEPRFGHDFSSVRIHRDSAAARSAHEVLADAYTVANHVVFAQGRYAPDSPAGRELLAHELAHVVQQSGGRTETLRRDGEKDADKDAVQSKIDVSIVLTEDEQDMVEGRTYAKKVLRVTSVEDAAKQLKALGRPIGTLFVVSHSNAAGQVEFISGIGTISWVPINDLAKAIKAESVSVDTTDFRGCKMGSAPGAMETFRNTVGGQSVKGSTCWTFVTRVTPLTYQGAEITSPNQIPKNMQKAFDKALIQQINGLKTEDNHPVKNCLLGLSAGETTSGKLAKVWKQYWANQGHLVASWASPDFNKNWQEGSICTKDMTTSTKPCALVEKTAPAAPSGGGSGGKKSAAVDVPSDTLFAGPDAPAADEDRLA
jgi:hypothetical protein